VNNIPSPLKYLEKKIQNIKKMSYQLLDSGDGEKLEQFGEIVLIRPAAQAVWSRRSPSLWKKADARFSREQSKQWELFNPLPPTWGIQLHGVQLRLKRTDFGHLGVFPEHAHLWPWMCSQSLHGAQILNLFAYSGATTLALAMQGAKMTHLDASPGMVQWARENALLNHLEKAPIRWIVDDVRKYLARAIRREERYDAILLDPPSFGRGKSGEVFKIENDLIPILKQCRELLSPHPLFFLLTCHTPGFTPLALKHLLRQIFENEEIEGGEMIIEGSLSLPSGTFVRWKR
jgi:23S rRNA (cytosine1962-C5)-methyltransferase